MLVNSAGRRVAALPFAYSKEAFRRWPYGVIFTSSATALVKLPAEAPGAYRIAFTPNSRLYPGATYGYASAATVLYFRRW
jgi:hypothetical protein